MYRYYQTPFEEIIGNILEVLSRHDAHYTFPTLASTAIEKPDLLKKIVESRSEVAAHGYNHVKYTLIKLEDQERDIERAKVTYQKMGVEVKGFRAPYNAYSPNTLELIEKHGFLWDGGIGYAEENRNKMDLFKLKSSGRDLNFYCVPLSGLSDDMMIDELGYSPNEMIRQLSKALDKTKESKAVIMFDLHPIRIGQPEYIVVLDKLISYGKREGGWFPTVTEAVLTRISKGDWNGYDFCCLLTGDIDNFHFRDYVRRLT
jgi:peptidoglycan/xylan/chitin deacetylase (PgdA/CDA1 family)